MSWWPLLLGIAVTPFTIRLAGILTLTGPGAFSYLYPYVALLRSSALGLSNGLENDISQCMMYLQFPLYGLLATLVMRSKSVWAGIVAVAIAHGLGVILLLAIAHI